MRLGVNLKAGRKQSNRFYRPSDRFWKSWNNINKQNYITSLLVTSAIVLATWRILKHTGGGFSRSFSRERVKAVDTIGYLYGWTAPQLSHRISLGENVSSYASGSSLVGRVMGPLSRAKVRAVASGEHTLILTSDGAIFSFGRDWDDQSKRAGQLGRGGRTDRPIRVRGALAYENVIAVAVGAFHSVAVTANGHVYTWGLNRRGQLGRITTSKEDTFHPQRVLGQLEGEKIVQVAAGRAHTLALTTEGKIYTWGLNYYPSEVPFRGKSVTGLDRVAVAKALEQLSTPRLVKGILANQKITSISSGPDHWLAINVYGELYSCGTGFGPDESTAEGMVTSVLGRLAGDGYATPGRVLGDLEGVMVEWASAGTGVSYAVTEDGDLLSWGLDSMLLGRDSSSDNPPDEPGEVENGGSTHGIRMAEVAAGDGFAVARSIEGQLFTWGDNKLGQLGRPAPSVDKHYDLVEALGNFRAISIAAGSHFGMAICQPPDDHNPEDNVDNLIGMKPVEYDHGFFPAILNNNHRHLIMNIEKDLFARIPSDGYDNRFKNPCWFEKQGGFYCLPYFFFTGSSRCGISDLYARVVESNLPGIYQASNRNPHWWDLSEEGVEWYLDVFKDASDRIVKDPMVITGEASPKMMMHSGLGVHGKPNQIELSELLYALLPRAKIVIMLRNPVERYRSAFYNFEYEVGKSFDQKAAEDVASMKKCLETFDVKSCMSSMHASMEHLCESMYAYPLESWLANFPREQLLILRFEDYASDMQNTILKVLRFLELSEPNVQVLTEIVAKPIVGKARSDAPGDMTPETRQMLRDFFIPHNTKLAEVLQDNSFLWNY